MHSLRLYRLVVLRRIIKSSRHSTIVIHKSSSHKFTPPSIKRTGRVKRLLSRKAAPSFHASYWRLDDAVSSLLVIDVVRNLKLGHHLLNTHLIQFDCRLTRLLELVLAFNANLLLGLTNHGRRWACLLRKPDQL